ncbi:MAG: TIGR03668 family PPOX class F420-dependent oxidoreductase [Chloroflexi bacterium]|nr:TIGR03668 family PPOX class F420-dependent oxidoreductase [Chloroflexota bacterium]
MDDDPVLTPTRRDALAGARRAVLATIAPDGRPRLVPICFTLDPDRPVLYSPLDDKPKRTADIHDLARVRDLRHDPRVTLLVDTWDEDWSQLAWTRCEGRASLLEPDGPAAPEHHAAVVGLRSKYPQYATHDLAARPIVRIELERATGWIASDAPPGQPEQPPRSRAGR